MASSTMDGSRLLVLVLVDCVVVAVDVGWDGDDEKRGMRDDDDDAADDDME